ncbi:CocE/NonD family hydrolase [Mucilaginibacter sp.]|jgi:putative CocE/NonD family hydrolase|uniref:CocE/NonD family hydrolase n=1 Tax=Mucilaginibacter sp. TaxID=1882438 RepID=UPI002C3C90FC|nr:CocE/NonD family hydrolase [Mucilaginibacter sp.]HTI57504.1 CocE/NonD family hydrolase [Mucilaginibacter sp.]
MRKTCLFALLLLPFFVSAQNADSVWFVSHYTKKEVTIPMRDGIKLFTSIYLPNDKAEKHPILMERTPYSCRPYGSDYLPFWRTHLMQYCKEQYIMVIQDVRGRWMSEGEFVDVRPFNPNKKTKQDIDESTDAYDTIDWMIKNLENNNGNVGVLGTSYPGFYSNMASLSGHPALKAVSPQAPVTDWFVGDDFHHNGAFFQMDAFDFYFGGGFGQPHPKPTPLPAKKYDYPVHDNYEFYLRAGALQNLTKLVGDSIKFWNEMMNHPNRDAWWQARNARVGVKDVKPAILIVGGEFDAEDCFGAWNLYQALVKQSPATNSRLVMGPWYHGQWENNDGTHHGNIQFGSNTSEWYANNIEVPFFNYYLEGKGSVDSITKATIYFTGENKWHRLPQWPPADMTPTPVYLEPKGDLSFSMMGNEKTSSDSYISDPAKPVPYDEGVHFNRTRTYMSDDQRFASRRTDVLSYQTDILNKDVTLGGPVVADLVVSLSNTDADFVVKLIDVYPDSGSYNDVNIYAEEDQKGPYPMGGYQMLVRAEIMRGKFRNSYEKPEPFVPGKQTEVKYTLPDVAHTFKKGHRIMIQIQSSWFPLVDRNPQQFMDIYHAKDSDFVKETINIYHDQSKIILPVLK